MSEVEFFYDVERRIKELHNKDSNKHQNSYGDALFYIIASVPSLYNSADKIYCFKENAISIDAFDDRKFSSGELALIRLGFNLFTSSNFDRNELSVNDIFAELDADFRKIAFRAIEIRFE